VKFSACENPPSPFGGANMTLNYARPATINSTKLFVFLHLPLRSLPSLIRAAGKLA